MKYLLLLTFMLSGCGIEVHGHTDPITVNPIQVQVSTTINYSLAQQFCSNQCGGNSVCASQCYDQFLAILAASSAQPVVTPTPNPTP